MKKLLILLFCAFVGTTVSAQKEVAAKSIFEQIDKKQVVDYQDITIVGTLDLTELSNKKRIKKIKSDYEEYKSVVEVPVSFKNCIFKDDMIAYKNIEDEKNRKIGNANINWSTGDGTTYTTDFEKSVVFENCTFEGKSEFKYSDFVEKSSFTGTKFAQSANFKYADFKQEINFSKCNFNEYANFKYSNFKQDADFYDVKFNHYADFKYSNFNERVTFKSSIFKNQADFKYTDFKNEGIFDNTKFSNGVDFKYSNGKKYINK
jgi:uncharacterized protein YjbI with pentapeptide repeats